MVAKLFGVIVTGLLLPLAVHAQAGIEQNPDTAANGDYDYIGCWNLTNVENGHAAFPGKPYTSSNMTIENCVAYCNNPVNGGPFSYAGVSDGNKCWCGNTTYIDRMQVDAEYNCNSTCSGQPKGTYQTCGGNALVEIYTKVSGRTPAIVNIPYVGSGYYAAGCYNYTDLQPYIFDNFEMYFDTINVCAFYCKWDADLAGPPGYLYGFAVGQTGYEQQDYLENGPSCSCLNPFDFSQLPQYPLSYCNRTCGHQGRAGDKGEICGGLPPYLLVYSNNTSKDFDTASKATSRASWSSSVTAASTSKASHRASYSTSKSSYSSSLSSARSRVSSSQASASASRSTARSSINNSKTSASLSRSTARSVGSTSKSSASFSRSSARSRVSASTSSAIAAKSSRSQSLSASKSSYLSRYTSSSSSRASAQSAYTSRSLSNSLSRSLARSSYTSRSQAVATSKSVNSALLSSSRSVASASRSSANAALASSATSNSRSLSSFYSSRSYSQYLASSSKSYSAYLASSSRSSASAAGNHPARYAETVSVTTTIIIDTSSSDVPLTQDTSSVTVTVSTDDSTDTITSMTVSTDTS